MRISPIDSKIFQQFWVFLILLIISVVAWGSDTYQAKGEISINLNDFEHLPTAEYIYPVFYFYVDGFEGKEWQLVENGSDLLVENVPVGTYEIDAYCHVYEAFGAFPIRMFKKQLSSGIL